MEEVAAAEGSVLHSLRQLLGSAYKSLNIRPMISSLTCRSLSLHA